MKKLSDVLDLLKDVQEVTEVVNDPNTSAEEKKLAVARGILKAMPEELRKAGAVTNPEAVVVALEGSMIISQKLQMEILFMLLTEPNKTHTLGAQIPSLKGACEASDVELHTGAAKPEVLKDGEVRATQKPGAA